MASLDNKDLDKTAKTGPYANMSRADIFRQKIKDKSDFIIGSTIAGKKVKGVSFDENAKVLYWTNSQKKTGVAKVSTIFKDSDLGRPISFLIELDKYSLVIVFVIIKLYNLFRFI